MRCTINGLSFSISLSTFMLCVNVKLSVYLAKQYNMNTHVELEARFHVFVHSALDPDECSVQAFASPFPGEESPVPVA